MTNIHEIYEMKYEKYYIVSIGHTHPPIIGHFHFSTFSCLLLAY